MVCLIGGQGAGKSTFFWLMAIKDEWFSDDLRRLDDDNIYRKLQGYWIIEMPEMLATVNAKIVEEIESFLSKQKDNYKISYEVHPEDRPRQCVFVGTSNTLDFLPLDRTGNRRFAPITVHFVKGKGSLRHNNREFIANNIDEARVPWNIVYIQQPLKEAYEEIFGSAVSEYNAKQKRSDRKIDDYLTKIKNSGNKEK